MVDKNICTLLENAVHVVAGRKSKLFVVRSQLEGKICSQLALYIRPNARQLHANFCELGSER